MTNFMYHELILGEIYISPVIVVITLAYILTNFISFVSVSIGFHKYIAAPAIAELSTLIIMTALIGQLLVILTSPLGHLINT